MTAQKYINRVKLAIRNFEEAKETRADMGYVMMVLCAPRMCKALDDTSRLKNCPKSVKRIIKILEGKVKP